MKTESARHVCIGVLLAMEKFRVSLAVFIDWRSRWSSAWRKVLCRLIFGCIGDMYANCRGNDFLIMIGNRSGAARGTVLLLIGDDQLGET